MTHEDHLDLLRGGIPGPGGLWADFGSGTGAFTLALAELIGPTGHIYSVDTDRGALKEQERSIRARFPELSFHYQAIAADFTYRLDLPALDGVVMANSLHYVRHKDPVLQLIKSYLRPGGRLILVEYNADHGNPWVPHPLSYPTWEATARRNGFASTHLLATVPSRFLREIYSAMSLTSET
ncbi:MAG TPA: class I SAM-dependent methyltransferase [Chloroflexia bacterium]|nr:class I SAM-dependent methyltransferase [Chloroflexia bacterium]